MEQVPHIAMFCQEFKMQLSFVVSLHLLPTVVKFLTDSSNQVRYGKWFYPVWKQGTEFSLLYFWLVLVRLLTFLVTFSHGLFNAIRSKGNCNFTLSVNESNITVNSGVKFIKEKARMYYKINVLIAYLQIHQSGEAHTFDKIKKYFMYLNVLLHSILGKEDFASCPASVVGAGISGKGGRARAGLSSYHQANGGRQHRRL